MGCFGYLCRGCGTQIVGDCFAGGEKAILIHVRHGEELGRVEGHYNEYGTVIEQKDVTEGKFRGDIDSGINSHKEICNSCFNFEDSIYYVENLKAYNNKNIDYQKYISYIVLKDIKSSSNKEEFKNTDTFNIIKNIKDDSLISKSLVLLEEDYDEFKYFAALMLPSPMSHIWKGKIYEDFLNLPNVKLDKYSGIVAWHSKCYSEATEEQRNDLTPSDSDPDQSWGEVREEFM